MKKVPTSDGRIFSIMEKNSKPESDLNPNTPHQINILSVKILNCPVLYSPETALGSQLPG